MDIKQDPNSIPNFGSGGRIGELQRDEPEEVQSSVELDQDDEGEAAAHESLRDEGTRATPDPSTTGGGAVDGLVGAP